MERDEQKFTPIAEVGEFGLIDRISQIIGPPVDENVRVGMGDDAAVYRVCEDLLHVITSDVLFEGVHFDRTFMPLEHLGYKSITINVSDVIAMNASPLYATVTLGIPNNFSVEMAEALYEGISNATSAYDMEVVGGDTNASQRLSLSVTAVGNVAEDAVVYRSGARPGDLIVVTGDIGASYAGLKVLLEQRKQFEEKGEEGFQPDLDPYSRVLQRHLRPVTRLDVIDILQRSDVQPRAMIDISDGLASEVHHICEVSDCGAVVREEDLPIDGLTRVVADEFDETPEQYALFGGEDYELVCAMPEEDYERLSDELFTAVGRFTVPQEGVNFETKSGPQVSLEARGFQHF
jgi:thiamine-monophosphate kinase